MTVNEFIEKLNELKVSGDLKLSIKAYGGLGRMSHDVESISFGFDWDMGRLILHTEKPLQLYVSEKQRKENDKKKEKIIKELKGKS